MPPSRRAGKQLVIFGAAAAIVAATLGVAGRRAWVDHKADTAPIAPHARQLLLAVDGLSWEAFTEARRRGMFRRFRYAGRSVAPYPSMSHPSWTEIIGTRRMFGARASLGVVAGTTGPVPAFVRGNEVLDVIGIPADSVLSRVAALAPHDPVALARGLLSGGHKVSTGREDDSYAVSFLRRARPMAVSMDYFDYDVMRRLLSAMSSERVGDASGRSVARARSAFRRADILGGVAGNVDTLVALMDSLDTKRADERVREAELRMRGIRELSPLADLRAQLGTGKPRGGDGSATRKLAMALWTLPYYLDDALAAPEEDSIPDTRDASFALEWHTKLRQEIASSPGALLEDSVTPRRLFGEVYAERKLRLAADPARMPLLYDPDLGDVTVVYVPGIYTELFDQEIWSRGLRAVRDRLGVRTLTIPVDGRCGARVNSAQIVTALREDTERRRLRGYTRPRYLILGYSKGGVDATEALLVAPHLARSQIAALVSIASPHGGTPVAERAGIPSGAMEWGVDAPRPAACDSTDAARTLWPSSRAAFWSEHAGETAGLTRYFSFSFETDMADAHPWMKLTKRAAEFQEPNDGVVALTSSRFPPRVHAIDLGTIHADHIAGRLASSFPQDAFLEAVVITVAELGALRPDVNARWLAAVAKSDAPRWKLLSRFSKPAEERVSPFSASLRPGGALPGGSSGWTPDRMFNSAHVERAGVNPVRQMSPLASPGGVVFRCDQRDMLEFRREYEFYYDSGNGGSEDDFGNGFSMIPSAGSATGRACRFATRQTAIKMTTVSFQFRPSDFPLLSIRLRVARNADGVDPGKTRRGKNDAAFKVWLLLQDTRPGADTGPVMFGYWWTARDASGVAPAGDSLVEALSSRRNVVVSTLPEAWLMGIGKPAERDRWQNVERDIAADIRRAYPRIPADALKVMGITLQSDSDESRGETEVFLESMSLRPRAQRGAGSEAAEHSLQHVQEGAEDGAGRSGKSG